MKSSSLKMMDAGIKEPAFYRDSLIHNWYLDTDYQRHLKLYVLAETTPGQFFLNFKDGELIVKKRSYSVTWIDSPAVCRDTDFLLVSLRYCEHLKRGYALVKVLRGEGKFNELEYK